MDVDKVHKLIVDTEGHMIIPRAQCQKKGEYQRVGDMNLVKEDVDDNKLRTCDQERNNTHALQFVTMRSSTKIQ
jgi:hypothetical protein